MTFHETVDILPTGESLNNEVEDGQKFESSRNLSTFLDFRTKLSTLFTRQSCEKRDEENGVENAVIGKKRIEDYRSGYPQYSSFIAAHNPYHLCRRFTQVRARLLLLKQDQLTQLEEELEQIDHVEALPIFLGSSRRDANTDRKKVLADLGRELREYDELVERNMKMLSYGPPARRDLRSVNNWINNTACIAADETSFLAKPDLLCIGVSHDGPFVQVEVILQEFIVFCYRVLGKRRQSDLSIDPKVHIFSSPLLKHVARGLTAWIVVLILLVPVIVINAIEKAIIRMGIIVIASAMVIMLLALMTKVKTWEMFLGGATYATVLVVFVASTDSGAS